MTFFYLAYSEIHEDGIMVQQIELKASWSPGFSSFQSYILQICLGRQHIMTQVPQSLLPKLEMLMELCLSMPVWLNHSHYNHFCE